MFHRRKCPMKDPKMTTTPTENSPLSQDALPELAGRIGRSSKQCPDELHVTVLDHTHQSIRQWIFILLQKALCSIQDWASIVFHAKLQPASLVRHEVRVLAEVVLASLNKSLHCSLVWWKHGRNLNVVPCRGYGGRGEEGGYHSHSIPCSVHQAVIGDRWACSEWDPALACCLCN